jgi:hypothetical protein
MTDTPKHNHAPIKMRAVEGGFDGIQQLGDFCINAEGTQIHLAIPSTRPFLQKEKGWTYITLPIGREKPVPGPSWQWDGNRERPTLAPSIWTHGHWHGFVRDGEMVEV